MDVNAAEIYEKYADELIRFASALVGPWAAEDVLANAMVRVLGTVDWSTVSAVRAYLYRAVLNEARAQHRATQRRLRREITKEGSTVLAAKVDELIVTELKARGASIR